MHEALLRGYADSTNRGDDSHWRAWEKVCGDLHTTPWRTDAAANSGLDPDGYQEEIFLLCTAMIRMHDVMVPR